ncbi:hypothetical protein EMN47_15720 [Prolixibacteraceae bacterium JC049]|nr:hypothetical protein [Prolixibacteraceae bacterium JC049]
MYIHRFFILAILLGALQLSSYAQSELDATSEDKSESKDRNDSIDVVIRTWHLKNGEIEPFKFDTLLEQFQNYNPAYRNDITATYQGNQGLAYQSNNFFKREPESGFYFYKNYENYVNSPNKFRYFNTTVPFTLLDYSQSENKNAKSETRLNVLHTQNVTDKLNLILDYFTLKSQGQYINQETKDRSINLGGNYLGEQYIAHWAFVSNKLSTQENGGIANDNLINDNTATENISFRINSGADSRIVSNTLKYDHLYRLGKYVENEEGEEVFIPRVSFEHVLLISGNRREYNDDTPKRKFQDKSIYPNVYRNQNVTADTVRFRRFSNRFQINAYEAPDRKYTFGKSAFIENELIGVHVPDKEVETFIKKNYNNTFIGGRIYSSKSKFLRWDAQAKFGVVGYKSGDSDLKATLSKPVKLFNDTASFTGSVRIRNIKPDYFQNFYRSNHYQWDNDFDFMQRMDVNFNFKFSDKLELGGNYALLSNYIYNDEKVLPKQTSKKFSVAGIYLNGHIFSGFFNMRTKLLLQEVSDDSYLRLPQFQGYLSTFIKFRMAKVMKTQLGVDTRYFTEFYGDAFDPATGMFHIQNERKIGNYPVFDLFANLKLKRTRAFFILQNAASGIIGKNQFSALHYPINKRTFRLGISWTFYD